MVTALREMPVEISSPAVSKIVIDMSRTYTIEEFMALPDDGKRYELVEGVLIEMQGPSAEHGEIIFKLSRYLGNYLDAHKKVGRAFAGTAFVLFNRRNTARIPDVAFVAAERTADIIKGKAVPQPPDLAVEVISPTDIWSEIVAKVAEYQQANVPVVWLIDPFSQIVMIYQLERGLVHRVVGPDAELDGENLLPDFKLKVSALFEE